ncbi:putative leucine-rich repeat-containing protein DDB_G0290503, partial [Halyomorpha halys]|uniref:putative leucine-rich repeat-containing protein DDB_G0290503 n=1 Tax=Halyomorpha halys TaxID=286706 RepID=UPI0034D18E9B
HHSYKQYNTTSSQTDIVDFVEQIEAEPEVHTPIFTWHRSASCKELRKPQEPVEIEKPQAKYERNFIIAGSKTPSLDRSGIEQDAKVYSSSYPGTTSSLSTESADEIEPGGSVLVMDTGSSREFSHDDLSHDSYELLEREAKSYIHSRSCSLGSSGEVLPDDEIFVIEDYKDDVEKRLGYVEPRYRDIGFNEFNEKCKLGFAKNREKNVEFDEFDAKCKPGAVIGYEEVERYPVERTKSEPYVSDFWKVARQHRKLFHQKSFDYTPTESIDSSEDRGQASKSTADIPYTLYKRQQMNGTSSIYECRSPVSPRKSPDKRLTVDSEKKKSLKTKNKLSKTKQDSDLNSQDSGLSLSLGAESVDDLVDQNSKNNALNLKPEGKYGGLKEDIPKAPRISTVKKDLLKVKSEDGPRTKGVLVKTKALSADSDLRKTPSFERNPPVEVIKIDSQDGEGIVICSSDDKNISVDTSDPDVIIVEYKTSRKRAFQKRGSSDSKSSIEKKVSSFDSQRSDSDTSRRRDKLRDWKSESSSSCDLPERIDFRRERFSKEIKTSIEGKVVRESKEEKELKKQRSEELERKKAEKLIKSKSESLDRNMDRDTKVPSLKALKEFKAHGYCTCDHETSFEKQRSFEKKGKSMEALIENKDEHQEIEVGKESSEKKSIKPVLASNEQKTIVDINKEQILKGNLPRREIDSETNDENDDVFLDVKKSDVTINKVPGKELKDTTEKNITSSSNTKTKIDASTQPHSFEKKALSETRSGKVDEHSLTLDSKHDTKRKVDKKAKPDWNLISSEVIIIEQDIVIIEKDKKNLHYDKKEAPPTKTKVPTDLSLDLQPPVLLEKPSPKDDPTKSVKDSKSEKQDMTKQVTSPEMVWKKFGELTPIAKRERSPILFARLGFSEGSAFSPTHSQSPASSRRAKSLDAPVVSLHRLPPITSFSSKDDTLDNDEGIELEEKSLRGIKPIQKEYVIEEEELSNISPVVQNTPVNLDIIKKDDLETAPENSVPLTENLEHKIVEVDLPVTSSETLPSTAEICQENSEQRSGSQVPSPLIINDKPPSESINTDDDTKSSPCTVAEISPDFNKISPIDKTNLNFLDLSDQDQALPEPKKLHSHLLKDMDKLSNASDEQKVPESDFFYESPRKPSDSSEFKYDDLEFMECEQQLDIEESIPSPVPDNLVVKQQLSPSKCINEETQSDHTAGGESLMQLSPDPVRKRSGSDILESDINEPSTERRPSTRQERLDSFKNTKSYSVDIWTSEETDVPGIPTVDIEEVDWGNDDDAFAPDPIEALKEHMSPKDVSFSEKDKEIFNTPDTCNDKENLSGEEIFEECEESSIPINVSEETVKNKEVESNSEKTEFNFPVVEDIIPLSEICEKIEEPAQVDTKLIPPKRSFDEDASSSSSIKPEKNSWVPFSLESSGSSSLEEGIFPPDDCSHFADEEEGSSNSTKEEYQGFGYSVVGAESLIGSYTGGVFGLSRTLSRISERSTTSEQERSDLEDDLSTKPSSRSLSVEDESLMSSDRQPSLSSDPSTNPEIEEHPLPPLPPEPLGFKIPPPLLNPEDEWPSPPNSSFETPIISNVEAYFMEFKPEEATKVVIPREVKQFDSSSDSDYENKTLHEDDAPESSTVETTVKLAVKHKRQTNSSDTSLGVSDFSSSTSTVKLQYYSCTVKSDDSSLAEFGSSLSTEMLASSRKNSDDSVCLRRRSYHAPQRSFDDYDSPYSESDESSRHQKRNYMNLPSPTSGGSGSLTPKKGMKQERRKEERRPGVKSIARSKCYSYYSLARSPPSDGSSSSLEMGEPPTTPNTIPRVSKRRRHVPPSKRRHRASADIDVRDGHLISVSSPSVVAYGKCHGRSESNRSQMSKQSSV